MLGLKRFSLVGLVWFRVSCRSGVFAPSFKDVNDFLCFERRWRKYVHGVANPRSDRARLKSRTGLCPPKRVGLPILL